MSDAAGSTAASDALRRNLVAQIRRRAAMISDPVAAAFEAVPRHLFVPGVPAERAYRDDAIITRRDTDGRPVSSSSQPTIMAIMLDQLDVRPGHRVLEIGTGTGYNAALLTHLVGPSGEVVTVDLDDDIISAARAALDRAGYSTVRVECGDGNDGFAAHAPYDRVIATVGVWDLAPAWSAQLADGGRIVVPLDLRGAQVSVSFDRVGTRWQSRSVAPCGFMRMRGPGAGPERMCVLDGDIGLFLSVPDGRPVDADALRQAMATACPARSTGLSVAPLDLLGDLRLWLALSDARVCDLFGENPSAPPLANAPVRLAGRRATTGIVDGSSAAFLATAIGTPISVSAHSVALDAQGYGCDGDRVATELASLVRRWDTTGRPGIDGLSITAFPAGAASVGGGLIVDKTHHRMVVKYRAGQS